jgi:hypothetical protein
VKGRKEGRKERKKGRKEREGRYWNERTKGGTKERKEL